MLIKLIIVI